jgi:catechol 2,3-dioxygenase-like lactoylglutathione lyase family enzyme
MLKRILHTGLTVPNLKASIDLYESLGFKVENKFHKSDISADVAMVGNGETMFELFEFHNLAHPQVEFIRNHIAIYSDSIEEDVDKLIKQGYELVIPITEGMVYRFAYVQDSAGMNYEIATDKN